MNTWLRRMAILVLAMSCGTAVVAQTPPPGPTLRIEGNVAKVLSLGVDDLKRFPVHTVEIRSRDESRRQEPARKYAGCLLRDVLAAAKPTETMPRDLRRSYIVASARDGYQVVLSWAELFISPVGDGVLVAYLRDGKPLAEGEGPIALVSAADTSAARHVKWLRAIEIRTAGR